MVEDEWTTTLRRTHYALGGSSEPIRGMCFVTNGGMRHGTVRMRGAQFTSLGSGVRCCALGVEEGLALSGSTEAAFWARTRVLRIAA